MKRKHKIAGLLLMFLMPLMGQTLDYAIGADVSFLKQAEEQQKFVIGQPYYPWWHGTLLDLRANLIFMASEYQKDIIVVEAAYNWKPAEYAKKPAPFPETPEGQREFLDEVNRIVLETPHGRGKGVFWWEPAVTGGLNRSGFFDNEGNALPVMTVFDKWARR